MDGKEHRPDTSDDDEAQFREREYDEGERCATESMSVRVRRSESVITSSGEVRAARPELLTCNTPPTAALKRVMRPRELDEDRREGNE